MAWVVCDSDGYCSEVGPDTTTTIPTLPGSYPESTGYPSGGNSGSTLGTILNFALKGAGLGLGYALQSKQIGAGQYPSTAYQNGFLPTGQSIGGLVAPGAAGGSWFWIIAIVLVLVLVMRK